MTSIPGPRGAAFVDAMLHFRRDSLGALVRCQAAYGDRVRFGWPVSTVLAFDLADIRHVLVDAGARFEKGAQTRELSAVMGEGLVTGRDRAAWARHRAIVQPTLGSASVTRLAPRFHEVVGPAVEALRTAPQPVDVFALARQLTFDVAARALLGVALSPSDREAVDEAVLFASHVAHIHMFQLVPVPYAVPTPTQERFHAHLEALDGVIARLVAEARSRDPRDPREGDLADGPGARASVLERLVAYRDDAGNPLGDRELRDELVTLLVAGYETSASTLGFLLAELAQHPEWTRALHAELDEAGTGIVSMGYRTTHPRLHATILETLRLHPAIAMTSHRAKEDEQLGDAALRAGLNVVIPTWVVQRDPRFFEHPERFDPARFLGTKLESSEAFLPFSRGERACVGRTFALVEVAALAARIVGALELRATSAPTRDVSEVSLRPSEPVLLAFTPRPVPAPFALTVDESAPETPSEGALEEAPARAAGCPFHTLVGASPSSPSASGASPTSRMARWARRIARDVDFRSRGEAEARRTSHAQLVSSVLFLACAALAVGSASLARSPLVAGLVALLFALEALGQLALGLDGRGLDGGRAHVVYFGRSGLGRVARVPFTGVIAVRGVLAATYLDASALTTLVATGLAAGAAAWLGRALLRGSARSADDVAWGAAIGSSALVLAVAAFASPRGSLAGASQLAYAALLALGVLGLRPSTAERLNLVVFPLAFALELAR